MAKLQGELVAMQEWVKSTGAKICIVFEGRDTAGKGGTIKRIVERVSPRVFRVVALPTPTDREKSQMYLQRYMAHFPAAGEVVIFDRSWYNRAGVEPVMGFCTPEQTQRFLNMAPLVEKAMVDSGIILLKYWLEVSADEQTRRLKSRMDDPRKTWKLSPMDLKSYSKLVRLLPGQGRHVRGDRHRLGAVVRREQRRQEARPAQHHQPPAEPGAVRAATRGSTSNCRSARRPATTASRASRCGASRPRSEQRRDEEEVMNDNPGAAAGVARGRGGRDVVHARARGGRGPAGRGPGPRAEHGRGAAAAAGVWPERPGRREAGAGLETVLQALPGLHADRARGRRAGQPADRGIRDRDRARHPDAVQRVAGLSPGRQGRSGRRLPGADDEVDGQSAARRRHGGDPRRADRARRHCGGRRR